MLTTLRQNFTSYKTRLLTAFGGHFLLLLFITQCLLKGIVFAIVAEGMLPLFKDMGVGAIRLQVLGAVALAPWTIKPLFGIISDLVVLNGYHKRYWMIISAGVGIVGAVFMVVQVPSPIALTFFLFMMNVEVAICDLLSEGKYAELMRLNPHTGSDIVTLVTGFQSIGAIIAMCLVGPMADLKLYRVTNIVALVMCVTPILPLLLGWMPEKRRDGPYIMLDTREVARNWKVIVVVAFTGLAAPATAAITAFAIKWVGLICSGVVLVVAVAGGYAWMPHRLIGHVALYQMLTAVSRISYGGPLSYFFLADEVCLPGGPHFSFKFYITVTGIVGAVTTLITVGIYQVVFSTWKYRNVLIFTSILSSLGGIFDFIIVMRWNLLIGIPDSWFFLIGDDVLHNLVTYLYWIPSSSIIGKVCPENMESCTYAYLAGVSNFATMVSTIAGAWLAELFGVVSSGENCNWDALPWLILGGHVLLVLVVSIPSAWLIPNVGQRENLLQPPSQEEEVLTEEISLDDPDTLPQMVEDFE